MINLIQKDNWLEQVRRAGKDFLRFKFNGVLTQNKALDLCNQWEKFCHDQPEKTFVIVFNATDMKNYEPRARVIFQKCIARVSKHIDRIWVVTDSKLVLVGASIVSLIIGLPIRVVRNEEQIVI